MAFSLFLDKVTGKCYTYTYDTYENVTEEQIDGVAFKTYEHDDHNRLTSTTVKVGNGTHVYRPIYDTRADGKIYADNAVVGVTLDGKFTARAEHDSLGRVTRKSLKLNGAASALIAEEFTYLTTAEGTNTRLTNMVESFTNKVNGVEVDKLTYVYDNNGNITEIKRNNEVIIQYAYDGLNQLIREDNAILGTICTYTYDTAGNITEKKVYNRTTLGVGTLEQTIPYTYATTGWKDRLVSYNGQAITYDALGNPTTYRGHNLVWGKIKQLESFDSNTFAYNASGIRTRKNNITYELDGTKILREVRGANVIEYFYGSGGVAGFTYNDTQYYYQKNLQGDIVAIYSSSGIKVAEYVYDAWGKCTVLLDTNGIGTINPFRYRGYYFDIETGLYYISSRYYDPEIGRFISPDKTDTLTASSMEHTDKNLYAYCDNNPVTREDRGGEFWNIIAGAVVGGTINLVSSIIQDIPKIISGEYEAKDFGQMLISTAIGAVEGAAMAACPGLSPLISSLASAADTAIEGIFEGDSVNEIICGSIVSGIIGLYTGAGGSGFVKGGKLLNEAGNSLGDIFNKSIRPMLKKASKKLRKKAIKYITREYLSGQLEDLAYGYIDDFTAWYLKKAAS